MGTDPAPFMANLFLYHYEQQHVLQLKKEDVRRARRLTHIFRFIDDLCVINDNGLFEQIYLSIYPEEMELKKENEGLSFSESMLMNRVLICKSLRQPESIFDFGLLCFV